MTNSSATAGELYIRAMADTQRIVERVRADQWGLPTPCSEWNTREVVNHIVGENLWAAELLQGKTIDEVGNRLDGDLTGENAADAYTSSVAAATTAVQAPGAMEATTHLSFGDVPGSEYASQLFLDTLIHGWDVAKATGQDTKLDPDLVAACQPIAERLTDQWRSSGLFGEKLEVVPGAGPQAELLALLGRRE